MADIMVPVGGTQSWVTHRQTDRRTEIHCQDKSQSRLRETVSKNCSLTFLTFLIDGHLFPYNILSIFNPPIQINHVRFIHAAAHFISSYIKSSPINSNMIIFAVPDFAPSFAPSPPQQGDHVVLQCTASILKEQIKLCLSCEGFGNRLCFLETTSNAQVVRGYR